MKKEEKLVEEIQGEGNISETNKRANPNKEQMYSIIYLTHINKYFLVPDTVLCFGDIT